MFDIHLHLNTDFDDFFKFNALDLCTYHDKYATKGMIVMPMIKQYCDTRAINNNFFTIINTKNFTRNNSLKPFLWAHPNVIDTDWIEELKPSGIKFHPSISQTTIDKATDLLDYCETYEIPFLIHCGRNKKSHIDHLIPYLESYTKVPIIIGHLGGLATELIIRTQKILETIKINDNIYFDTSGCVNPQLILNAINQFGADKILYGSDIPFFNWQVCKYAIELAIINMEKDLEQNMDNIRNMIYYENAVKLFEKYTGKYPVSSF